MWIRSGLFAGLLALGIAPSAMATPYFDSLTTNTSVGSAITTTTVGNSFTATSQDLSELEIALEKTSALSPGGSVVITLNADNGLSGSTDGPGSVLYALGTVTDASMAAANTKYVFDFYGMGIVSLTAGSEYWIEITKVATTKIDDFTTALAPTVGGGSYATKTTASFSSNINPPEMSFCVSGDGSCISSSGVSASFAIADTGVPEPASLAILGAGLIGTGWSRRRRAKRSPSK